MNLSKIAFLPSGADTAPHHPSRRRLLGCGAVALVSSGAATVWAAPRARAQRTDVVVPIYGAEGFLLGHWKYAQGPAARAFAHEARDLAATWAASGAPPDTATLESSLRTGRDAWIRTLHTWLALSTVATGPVVERRAVKALDFQPPRPELIRRAVERAAEGPLNAEAMERIGTPAKGLPALEHLLWSTPAEFAREPALWHYLKSASADLAREAQALSEACTALATTDPDEETVAAGVAELINQLLGAVELLRWRDMERPARAGDPQRMPYPRQRSGQTLAAWKTAWRTLRELCRTPGTWPEPGRNLVPLALYLRSLGQIGLADRLDERLDRIDDALLALPARPAPSAVVRTADTLKPLRAMLENEIASAVKVRIGFSDNDGD